MKIRDRGILMGTAGLITALAGAASLPVLLGGLFLLRNDQDPDQLTTLGPSGHPPELISQPPVWDVPFLGSPILDEKMAGSGIWAATMPPRHLSGSSVALTAAPTSGPTREEIRELGLQIRIDERRQVELPIESLFALPGDTVGIRAYGPRGQPLELEGGGEEVDEAGSPGSWIWTPGFEPGLTVIVLRHRESDTTVKLHAFTMVPADSIVGEKLNGYRIGSYPHTPLRGDPIYLPPRGFVEVTEQTAGVRVSPHFKLMHFPAKQGQGYPKYLVLRPALLKKLEWVLEAMVDRGYPVRSFHVMSGYRTPYYNVQILGNVQYSRHQWGGAADVFIDEHPRNGVMDDLDGDGRVTLEDARRIHALVDSLELDMGSTFPVGGLGLYAANSVRGPFVHMDVRGQPARW